MNLLFGWKVGSLALYSVCLPAGGACNIVELLLLYLCYVDNVTVNYKLSFTCLEVHLHFTELKCTCVLFICF